MGCGSGRSLLICKAANTSWCVLLLQCSPLPAWLASTAATSHACDATAVRYAWSRLLLALITAGVHGRVIVCECRW